MFKTLSLFLLLQGASAMYVKVNGYQCSEKAMSLTLTKICNEEDTCLLGENASIEGYVNYYGMVDEYGVTDESYAYLDMSLKFTQNGAAIYSHDIYSLQKVAICSNKLTAMDGGSCPSGGRYSFQQSVYLPAIENQFKDWGYSGFSGQAELTAYMGQDNGSTVLGYCTLDITTTTSGTFAKAPSGRAVLIGIFSAVSVLLCLAVVGFFCAKKEDKVYMFSKVSKSTRQAVKKAKQAAGMPTSPNDFKRMEEETNAEAKQNWKLDWDSKAAVGTHPAQKQVMNV